MQGKSAAINILEADGPGLGAISVVGIYHDAIPASAWRRPTPHLSAAVQRAFSWRYAVVKRTLDILLSSILIILFFPVMLVVAIAVALTSPGPIFFYQERLGRFGAPFRIIKFRSMFSRKHKDNVFEINGSHRRCEADYKNEEAYPLNKETRDPRITPVGRIIRKLSLDELPSCSTCCLEICRWSGRGRSLRQRLHCTGIILPITTCSGLVLPVFGRYLGGAMWDLSDAFCSIANMRASGVVCSTGKF